MLDNQHNRLLNNEDNNDDEDYDVVLQDFSSSLVTKTPNKHHLKTLNKQNSFSATNTHLNYTSTNTSTNKNNSGSIRNSSSNELKKILSLEHQLESKEEEINNLYLKLNKSLKKNEKLVSVVNQLELELEEFICGGGVPVSLISRYTQTFDDCIDCTTQTTGDFSTNELLQPEQQQSSTTLLSDTSIESTSSVADAAEIDFLKAENNSLREMLNYCQECLKEANLNHLLKDLNLFIVPDNIIPQTPERSRLTFTTFQTSDTPTLSHVCSKIYSGISVLKKTILFYKYVRFDDKILWINTNDKSVYYSKNRMRSIKCISIYKWSLVGLDFKLTDKNGRMAEFKIRQDDLNDLEQVLKLLD